MMKSMLGKSSVRFCGAVLFLMLVSFGAVAQDEVGFTADRPGALTGPDVLPRGRVQWETGVGGEFSKVETPSTTSWTINSSMLRWGFSDFAELRVQGDYIYSEADGKTKHGFGDLIIGTKAKLFEGSKFLPAISLLANVLVAGEHRDENQPRHTGAHMGLLFSHELSSRCSLGYEADLIWSGKLHPTAFFGVGLSFSLGDRITLSVEEFNYSRPEGIECWSELSMAYQLSRRVQLDLGTDFFLNAPAQYHNLMLGVTWQLNQ